MKDRAAARKQGNNKDAKSATSNSNSSSNNSTTTNGNGTTNASSDKSKLEPNYDVTLEEDEEDFICDSCLEEKLETMSDNVRSPAQMEDFGVQTDPMLDAGSTGNPFQDNKELKEKLEKLSPRKDEMRPPQTAKRSTPFKNPPTNPQSVKRCFCFALPFIHDFFKYAQISVDQYHYKICDSSPKHERE